MHITTNHPVATDSPDHTHPWGTRLWGRTNGRFNVKLLNLALKNPAWADGGAFPSLLDLGCASGEFVRSAVDFGIDAYGIEGSDLSKNMRRGAWRDMPERLATADIGKQFELERRFNVITAWEVVEHLDAHRLCQMCENVKAHLDADGIFIVSTADGSDCTGGKELHQTQMTRRAWETFFKSQGFRNCPALIRYFNTQFVRGPKFGSETSFHFVLVRDHDWSPIPPKEPPLLRVYDRWLGCRLQRFIGGTHVQG